MITEIDNTQQKGTEQHTIYNMKFDVYDVENNKIVRMEIPSQKGRPFRHYFNLWVKGIDTVKVFLEMKMRIGGEEVVFSAPFRELNDTLAEFRANNPGADATIQVQLPNCSSVVVKRDAPVTSGDVYAQASIFLI